MLAVFCRPFLGWVYFDGGRSRHLYSEPLYSHMMASSKTSGQRPSFNIGSQIVAGSLLTSTKKYGDWLGCGLAVGHPGSDRKLLCLLCLLCLPVFLLCLIRGATMSGDIPCVFAMSVGSLRRPLVPTHYKIQPQASRSHRAKIDALFPFPKMQAQTAKSHQDAGRS